MIGKYTIVFVFLIIQGQIYCQCDSIAFKFLKLKFERKIEETYSYLTMKQLIPSQWYDNLNGKILASEYNDTTITLKIEISFKANTQIYFAEPERVVIYGDILISKIDKKSKFTICEKNEFANKVIASRKLDFLSSAIEQQVAQRLSEDPEYQNLISKAIKCTK